MTNGKPTTPIGTLDPPRTETKMSDTTELERREVHVITTPAEYGEALRKWVAQRFNILTPFENINGIAPAHVLYAATAKLNLDPAQEEVYSGWTKDGRKGMPFLGGERGAPNEEFAIAKRGLRRLASLAGISYDTDDESPDTFWWKVKAIAEYTDLDGSRVRRTGRAEWDLRPGSPRLKNWDVKQTEEGRKNGYRNCESRAINAAIRECGAGIKQKYTRAELERPFVVVRCALQPDLADPDIKRIVTMQALEGRRMLYERAPRELAAPPIDITPVRERTAETVPSGTASTPPAAAATNGVVASSSATDGPPNRHAVKIREAKPGKSGEKNGRPWTLYIIVDSNGVEATTFSKTTYDDALRFKSENAWVEVVAERQGEYNNIIEIVRAQADLPGLDEV